jgi:3-hydroxybutyryl-CoA dehydrogenase
MKKQDTHHTHVPRSIAVAGDTRLVEDITPLLEANGFTLLPAADKRALASAAADLAAGLELTISDSGVKKERLQFLDAHLPASTMILSSSVTVTAARQAAWMNHPERLIGFSAFPTLMTGPLAEIAVPVQTTDAIVRAAQALFAGLGIEIVSVQDRVGMIFPGLLSQVINEALFTAQYNVASPEDIDAAMKAGAGYPLGPIEWGEKIGFASIVGLLDAMRNDSGEERYRVSPLLRQLSLSGKFWHDQLPAPEPVQEVLPLDDVPLDSEPAAPSPEAKKKQRRDKKAARIH